MKARESLMGRRDFVILGAATAAALGSGLPVFGKEEMPARLTKLPMTKLPYAPNALAPYISEKTVGVHYSDHHKQYYLIVKRYLEGILKEYAKYGLEDLIVKTKDGINEVESLHYMSVLLYNHNLYWASMKPQGGGTPKGNLGRRIDKSFGSYDAFRKELIEKAMAIGSGWVTLARSKEALLLVRTDYHDSPLLKEQEPLLTLDVWEHAYYLDYLNDKEKYVNAFLDHLVNWDHGEARLKQLEESEG